MYPSLRLIAPVLFVLIAAACGKAPVAVSPAPPPVAQLQGPKPVASILDLMSGQLAPTSELLWNAVGTTSGPKGAVEKRPHTDADWAELRRQAMNLAEAANLLAIEGREVAHPGQKYLNPPGPGDLSPEKAQVLIAAERPTWLAYALVLQGSALATIKAIDARDVDAFTEAGGAIDEACEQCHKKFWYPEAPTATQSGQQQK
jgi:hypothetical protein